MAPTKLRSFRRRQISLTLASILTCCALCMILYWEARDYEKVQSSSTNLKVPRGVHPKLRVRNIALSAELSSEFDSACRADNAVDGNTARAFHGICKNMATTKAQDDPWLKVYFNKTANRAEIDKAKLVNKTKQIWSIEVWTGLKRCNSVRFSESVQCDGMHISEEMPLVLEFLFDESFTQDHKYGNCTRNFYKFETRKTFTDAGRIVYAWEITESLYSSAEVYKTMGQLRGVKISLPGKQRQLSVQEVKVWALVHVDEEERISLKRGICKNDKVGDDCLTDLNLDWAHLPQSFMHAQDIWNSTLFEDLVSSISKMQTISCSNLKTVTKESYNIGMGGKGAGFASTLHFLSGYLSDAYLARKAWIFGGRLNYAVNSFCAGRKLSGDTECYFQPYTGTKCRIVKISEFRRWKAYPANHNRCAMPKNRCKDLTPWGKLPTGLFGERGFFWFRTSLVSYMMRLNPQTRIALDLETIKMKIGFVKPIIGVHIRRGDACHTTKRKNRCRSFEQTYLPHIKTLSEKYGISRVFLATDDEAILEQIKSSKAVVQFEFVHVIMDRSVYNNQNQIEQRQNLYSDSSSQAHEMMLQALTDLLLLSETDAFVGHFLSNLSRLAIEMSSATKGYVPPFISVDGQWCKHWKFCR